jgi:hypothetical protein
MIKNLLYLFTVSLLAVSAHADVEVTVSQTPSIQMKGLHINRPASEPYAAGIMWDWEGQSAWATGLDITRDYPGTPDLVLAFSRDTLADNLRMRADDARTVLGPRVGHPIMPFQFSVVAGTEQNHLGGIGIGTYGWQHGIYMFNRGWPSRRTFLNFYNLYGFGTDTAGNGDKDFFLTNFNSGTKVLTLSADNRLGVNVSQLGFYGAAPTAKPVVTGSWSDGTAARSMLSALVRLGLAEDQTTP